MIPLTNQVIKDGVVSAGTSYQITEEMYLILEPDIFIYLGAFAALALILAFCLSYCCLKDSEDKDIFDNKALKLVAAVMKEMVKITRCCLMINKEDREIEDSPVIWTCSCDIQIYSH